MRPVARHSGPLNRLVAEAQKARRPSSVISLDHVIDEWLRVAEHEDSTPETYVERTIKPALGSMSIAKLHAELMDRARSSAPLPPSIHREQPQSPRDDHLTAKRVGAGHRHHGEAPQVSARPDLDSQSRWFESTLRADTPRCDAPPAASATPAPPPEHRVVRHPPPAAIMGDLVITAVARAPRERSPRRGRSPFPRRH